jgi:hypothetical protein
MRKALPFVIVMFLAISGCTTAGPKYVDLYYNGQADGSRSGKIGIAVFSDSREGAQAGYVGTRYLGKSEKETYYAFGDDLALSVTGICKSYLQDEGFTCMSVPAWEYTPEGATAAGHRFDYLVGGEIKQLDCFAVKKIGFTAMTLEIEIVFYIGDPGSGTLRTTPIKLKMERNEVTFSEEKLQKFLNDSLLEVTQKALILKG